jgi:hypothetical protein
MHHRALIIAIALAVASLLPCQATAQGVWENGGSLKSALSYCDDSSSRFSPCALAYGYIRGVLDTLEETGAAPLCIRGGVTNAQLGEIVLRYLRAHPEEWDLSGALIVHRALSKAFPCR